MIERRTQPVAPNCPIDEHHHEPGVFCAGCWDLMVPPENDRESWRKKELNAWILWYAELMVLFNNGEPKEFDALLQEGPKHT